MTTEKHDWYARMVRKLQLGGKSEQTVQAYTRAAHQLTKYYQKDPEFITGEDLKTYFLYRRNESEWAPKTLNLCYCGIRFYYQYVSRYPRASPLNPARLLDVKDVIVLRIIHGYDYTQKSRNFLRSTIIY